MDRFSIALLALGVLSAGSVFARTPKDARSRVAPQVVDVTVTGDGFVPAEVRVKTGVPVTLRVTRKTERTCATDIVIKDQKVNQPLPLDQTVEVKLPALQKGKVRFACAMDMISGDLVVE